MKIRNAILGAGMSLALVFSGTGIALAVERTPSDLLLPERSVTSQGIGISSFEEEHLAQELEILFTRYVQLGIDDSFTVNEANLRADGHADKLVDLNRLAAGLNSLGKAGARNDELGSLVPIAETRSAGSFALCVGVNGLGIPAAGASPGLVAAIKEGIRAWNWGLTAKTVARILGSSATKALGGPIGIGVALGWAAWTCRGEL
ncbi:hypothetical protein ACTOVL_08305 [Arcanobacterium canis]